MPASAHFKHLAKRCSHIASEISDANGFISIQKLIKRFGAQLFMRPLLVEGMIASSEKEANENSVKHQWCLFIDNETYPVSDSEIALESFGSPLPARFRNTVAHELAHSLAFRATEFGVVLPKQTSEKSRRTFVEEIERNTEKLSPLLLVSSNSLDSFFSPQKETLDVQQLSDFQRSIGVSRPVFINRLNLLSISDEKRLRVRRKVLQNAAIGMGQWKADGKAVLKDYPLYSFFEGGKVPSFIFKLQKGIEVLAHDIFSDIEFALLGGKRNYIDCVVPAGTPKVPDLIQLPVRISAENVKHKAGTEFLFTIQRAY